MSWLLTCVYWELDQFPAHGEFKPHAFDKETLHTPSKIELPLYEYLGSMDCLKNSCYSHPSFAPATTKQITTCSDANYKQLLHIL